ncbi:MAG TPA: protein kinase [Minicystis sp.]|nr:protein kinase [Minicystis sp.]
MPDQRPLIGRTVASRFRVKRVLGEGGMAMVYVAEQDEEPRRVALKIMNEELTRDRTFVRRFEREAKAASLVVHPNSVHIVAYGVADGLSYIAMELVEGDDLYVLLERGGPIAQARAARILAEVCAPLQVAHTLGIVHRDLKPENIMVVPDPSRPNGERVKVLDFGIAKLVAPDLVAQENARRLRQDSDPASGLTQAGTLIGTPAYMSPEQCQLQAIDARSDLYTCGVLLYQLVTGKLPFEGEAPLHTAMLHIHEPVRKPSEVAPDLDPRLEAVILRALAKKPADRYATAMELGAELGALATSLPDKPATPAGSKGAVSSRQPRAASLPAAPKRFPETLRWHGDAPGEQSRDDEPNGVPALESARTIVADGKAAPPASVRLRRDGEAVDSSEPPTKQGPERRAETAASEPPSSDPADRAKTLVRETDESFAGQASSPARPRSGPLGTEVMQLPLVAPSPSAPKKREIKATLRSADEFRPAQGRPVEIHVAEEPPMSAAPQTADDAASRAVTLDAEARVVTIPMGIQKMQPQADLGFHKTLPASAAKPQRASGNVATLELTERPRFVEPFPMPRAAPARPLRSALAQMSGARVLLVGFLAGAVLMGIVGVLYFYVIR